MKFLKWSLFFLFSFAVSWILISTFSQDEFSKDAPGVIFVYSTPSIPIYIYVAGAFLLGLLIGLTVAVFNYISLTARGSRKSRQIKSLEKDNAKLRAQFTEAEAQKQMPPQALFMQEPKNDEINGTNSPDKTNDETEPEQDEGKRDTDTNESL